MKKNSLIGVLLVIAIAAFGQSESIENEHLQLSVNNKSILIESKQIKGAQVQNLQVSGTLISIKKQQLKDPVWGQGQQLEAFFNSGHCLSLSLYEQNPFVFLHTVITNQSSTDVQFQDLPIATFNMSINANKKRMNSLGSGGLTPANQPKGSFFYSMLADPVTRNSIFAGWLTQKQGVGYFMPSWDERKKSYQLRTGLEFGNYLIKAREKRDTDVLLIGFFADGREALELYGDYIARAYNIRLPKRPEVYCTWYHRNLTQSGASTEEKLSENARFARKELAPFGLNAFQIDDHWQSSMIEGLNYKNKGEKDSCIVGNGPLKSFAESNFNFPSGMAVTANNLNKEGFMAGIWFMPFSGDMRNPYFKSTIFAKRLLSNHPFEAKIWSGTSIDATNPEGEAFLRNRFKRIYDWGYRYYKVDGLHIGAPSENLYIHRIYDGQRVYSDARLFDPTKTFTQCYRRGLEILNEESPEVFILGCSVTQNMSSLAPSFGLVHAMRVGPDNDGARSGRWKSLTDGADFSGNLYFLNNRVWYNDPDPYYVRESNPLNKARWMVSWQSVAGVMSTTSIQYAELSDERLDIIKRGLPTHSFNARPIDILESDKPRIWKVGNERMDIVGLFNWSEKEPMALDYPLSRMGFEEGKSYELFDFWGNTYLGTQSGSLKQTVAAASCLVLSVRPSTSYPQIISTSRHITQGLMDVLEESWNEKSMVLNGRSDVVKDDSYELRVIIPETKKIKRAICNGKPMIIIPEKGWARVVFTPQQSEIVNWKIYFESK